MTAAHVVVSGVAWSTFGELLRAAAPQARWSTIDPEGVVSELELGAGGRDLDPTGPDEPNVLWLSNDTFYPPLRAHLTRITGALAPGDWVQSGAAGTDSALFVDMIDRGLRLTTSHVTAVPIAEYTMGAVLRWYQEPERWADAQHRHQWEHHDFREVSGTTWLIVGLGAIGTEVAIRARAFGATTVGVRRHPTGDEPVDRMITPDQLGADEIGGADVIVLALPSSDGPPLVDAVFLDAVRPDAVLVNVARGSVVDEPALLAALDAGRLGHAVLDVTATEPLPDDSPLWDHPRVTLTPHSAGGGLGRFLRSAQTFTGNLERFLADEPLRHEVTPPTSPSGTTPSGTTSPTTTTDQEASNR